MGRKMTEVKKTFDDYRAHLNPAQREAVDAIDGPVMVVAGPGTGKTEVLSLRVVNILKNRDVYPGNILCLTFTDAAAVNMRNRLLSLLGPAAYRVAIHTFHTFGIEIINRYPEYFYEGAQFVPADATTQIEVLEDIFSALSHDNPLRSTHNGRFIHLRGVLKAIEQIKKAGLSPDDFEEILKENKKAVDTLDPLVQPIFTERVSKKMVPLARELVDRAKALRCRPLPQSFQPFAPYVAQSLEAALNLAETEGTRPLTEWKGIYTAKGDDGVTHLSDFIRREKLDALAAIYRAYTERMHEAGYYDYNDMILDTIGVLSRHSGVRYELQERYQYILVDEFQDTNNAQMRLLELLSDHPVNEGRPNIMVVGDDDQAIFKFQGAEVSNIIDFSKRYRDPQIIVLKSNYRSTQDILDVARRVILRGENRLERQLPNLKKELAAAKRDLAPGAIVGKKFPSRDAEYQWVVSEVRNLREARGIREIAIIARRHEDLETLVPYFHSARIPLTYEREENVLRSPFIIQLVTMARFINSLMKKEEDADDLLPDILSYPFWGIPRGDVWAISIRARRERKPWLMVMREQGGELRAIADFFLDLGARARYATAEEILHELIGGPELMIAEGEDEEELPPRHEMFSPFRSYYFGVEKFRKNRAEYLHFLSSLQSFVRTLREYRPGQFVSTEDMLAFVDIHTSNDLPIDNTSQFTGGDDAVQFMTAHKAKGLEFEAVFVLNCENDIWASSRGRRDIAMPSNLPIGPAGDNLDDQLRLFYVAITRAKRLLYFVSSQYDARGREVDQLEFLAPPENAPKWFISESVDMGAFDQSPETLLSEQWNARHTSPFTPNEKKLLEPVLERYQLSVTHLQNFLNVADAGPTAFFEKNLLMFPEPKSASSAFGSAVHATIKRIYAYLKKNGKTPSEKSIVGWFESALKDQRLNRGDYERMRRRGVKLFETYYPEKKKTFLPTDIVEFNFGNQGVVVGNARLTGKVDRMVVNGGTITVCDFKTGRAITTWTPDDYYEKVKAWKYRQQIIFYKLLIENSRDFGGTSSVPGGFIEFLEPYRGKIVDLHIEIDANESERLSALVNVVYRKIQSLDFPNVSGYSKDIKGIRAFEEDLLNGTI